MSTKSGRTTQRVKVASYNGFSIIKVKVISWYKSLYTSYYSNIPQNVEIYFDFCKEGNENRPTQAYSCSAKSVEDCKGCIDKFLQDDSLYFTDEEREKYVYKPNHRCGWAYGYVSLMKIMREHQKADKRMKVLLEDRLEDANFHTECGLLANRDYEGFEKLVSKDYQFNEKFEVYTKTMCKRIKDPKRFEEGLSKVIAEYLASQGVKNTSVETRFVENW